MNGPRVNGRRVARPGVAGVLSAIVLPAAAIVAGAIGGCGGNAPDLMLIQRSGQGAGAGVTLVVRDDGSVRCPASMRRLSSPQLLQARQLARDVQDASAKRLSFGPGPQSVLSYAVTSAGGRVSFSDTSPGLPPALLRLEGFARVVARQVCGLAR
jgi:hypothetical protein